MNKDKITFILTLIIAVVLVSVAAFLLYPLKNIGKIESKENISDLSQLPAWVKVPGSAKNVSYCKIFSLYSGYEFDISEEEFLQWSKKWPPQKITEPKTFVTFRRYTFPSPDYKDSDALEEYDSIVYRKFSNGYYYFKENKNQNGGGVTIAYDKDKQRAYYSFEHR